MQFKHLIVEPEVPGSNPGAALIFKFLIHFKLLTKKKKIEIFTKIDAKIMITVVKNRKTYYFITIL